MPDGMRHHEGTKIMNENDGIFTDTANPNVRVRLVFDVDPERPYGDVMAPAVVFNGPDYRVETWSEYKQATVSESELYDAAHHFDGEFEMVARWLRMFHGVTTVETITAQDGTLLIFDTPDWREHLDDDGTEPADLSGDVTEWRAWLDHDVYGIITERRVSTRTTVMDVENGEIVRQDDAEGWDEHESVWGFYGRTYAEGQARNTLRELITPEGMCATHHDRPSAVMVGVLPMCEECANEVETNR